MKLIGSAERTDDKGNVYYTFEFTSAGKKVKRHAISAVNITNGSHPALSRTASFASALLCSPAPLRPGWDGGIPKSSPA